MRQFAWIVKDIFLEKKKRKLFQNVIWALSSKKSAFEHTQNVWIHIILHMSSLFRAFALHWNIP